VYESLAKLYGRATGGSGVAADPGEDADVFFPEGPKPAGIDVATKWFDFNRSHNRKTFLFLVGGPGGGKSHVSSGMVQGFTEVEPKTKSLAHRNHLYDTPNGRLLLVNDATIKVEGLDGGFLKTEISESVISGYSLIACVNRGILLEESAYGSSSLESANSIVEWVSNFHSTVSQVTTTIETEYLKLGFVEDSTYGKIYVAVVYVDVCSLLEKLPQTEIEELDGELKVVARNYSISQLFKRSELSINEVPALNLIRQVALRINADLPKDSDELNPVIPNIRNLLDDEYLHGVGNILRASEIASGQRFSYREIWGLISRLILGNLTKTVDQSLLEAHIESLVSKTSGNELAFTRYMNLANLRTSQAAFEITTDSLTNNVGDSRDAINTLLCSVDPLIDSAAGRFDRREVTSGWADPLMDAFSGAFAGSSPLEALIQLAKENEGDAFGSAVTDFERALDSAFTKFMAASDLKPDVRERSIRWYSTYLSRLYAMANGIPAFRFQLSVWIDLAKSVPTIPNLIEKQILTVIRPPKNSGDVNSASIIPLFDSRTLPMIGYSSEPKLGIELNDMKVKTHRVGDELFLIVEEHSEIVARILLDFALIREICAASDGYVGVTELSNSTTPRLERLRSSRLTPHLLNNTVKFSLVQGSSILTVTRQELS